MGIDVDSLYNRRADNRWERTSVGDLFERVAVARPHAEALVGRPGAFADPATERVTYAEADEFANRFANGLIARGLHRGDRVLMLCENSIEALLAKIGIAKAGCVAVPVNPAQVRDVMDHAMKLTEPKLLIADTECRSLADAVGRTVDVTIPIGDGPVEGVTFQQFCRDGDPVEPEVTIHGDDIWEILFTSGTTAMPKGVMISHHYSYLNALSWVPLQVRGLRHESLLRTVCFSPIVFHVGDHGWVMPALVAGGTVVLGRRIKAPLTAAAVAAEKATLVVAGARPLALKLLDELEALGPGAVSSLTCIIHAIGLLAPGELARFQALSPGVSVNYIAGQTECVTAHRFTYDVDGDQYVEARDRDLNLVGSATSLLASTVVDIDDGVSRLPHGVDGELVYRSPAITAGYYRDQAATERAFAGGWFHSGDVGTTEPSGARSITGRLKDMIKTGGENVASARVESVIAHHPDVDEVAVIGLPDSRWGEAVTAVVVARPGTVVDAEGLIAFCRNRLPGYETPKRVIIVDELPKGFTGKILKNRLRERLVGETGN